MYKLFTTNTSLSHHYLTMRLPNISSTLHKLNQNKPHSSLDQEWKNIITHFIHINNQGLHLESLTSFPLLFKACTNLHLLKQGTSFHAYMIKQSLDSFTSIANSTMDFYMKCRDMSSALRVFACMENKDSVSWNILVHGYLSDDVRLNKYKGLCMFVEARAVGFVPNISTLILVLHACRSLRDIRKGLGIHGFLIRSGFFADVSVQNSLLSFYSEFDEMEFAQKLFDEMSKRDVVSVSVVLGAYIESGDVMGALLLFKETLSGDEVDPDEYIVVSILKACTLLRDIGFGRSVHCFAIRKGFCTDMFVGNSLVDMYSKCFGVDSALEIFSEMPGRNIVSWNSILFGLALNRRYLEALTLFPSMWESGIEADEVTMVTLLQICKNLGDPMQCRSIHSQVIRQGFSTNELVRNSLIDAYAKCSLVQTSSKLFRQMEQRDTISWSTMIKALSHSGEPEAALALFQEMALLRENFNYVTILSLLEACSLMADLRRSKWAHGIAIRNQMALEVVIGTALLDMYSKCGAVDLAREVFDQMPDKNIVSWSAMIAACGTNGRVHDALFLLKEMELHGLKPNAVTMISVLSACSHGGLIEEGYSCFKKMIRDQEFQPSMEHYSCMVDMFGRAGSLNSAMEVIKSMPEGTSAGASVWGALLSACRNYVNGDLGREAATHVLELEPCNAAGFVLASSMYAASGLWEDAARMRRMVKDERVKVVAGYSLVRVENRDYRFLAADSSRPQSKETYSLVKQLHDYMKMEETGDEIITTVEC